MPPDALGPWKPLSFRQVVRIFEKWPGRWWISGGVALELHLGRSWRSHEDSDVSVLRTDVSALTTVLNGWDIQIAAASTLTPWDGGGVSSRANQNNLWCRRAPDQPWSLDVTISEGDQECWIFRRDPTLQVRWEDAVLGTDQGVPYLEPVLQLLYKSKNNRPKDDRDATEVIPTLAMEQRRRLRSLLPVDHAWQQLLDPARDGT